MKIRSLELRNLSFGYRPGELILDQISVPWPMEKSVWVQGSAGSGRSTLLKLMALVLEPTAGELLLNNQVMSELSFEESVPYRLRIGYVSDQGGLLHNRTLRDNIMLPAMYHNIWPQNEVEARADELLKRFNLTSMQAQLPAHVSGSQRKIVTLLRALILEPELLLLDEPSWGLSSKALKVLTEQIEHHRKNLSLRHLVFTSSDDAFARAWTETEIFVHRSELKGVAA